jgi:DNA-directed RNA polymerase specialized sigma24 family protein
MAREALRQFDTCDEVLAVQAQHGSADSFAAIVVRWQVPVVRYLRHRTASLEDVEDPAQDVFVRACENLHRYQVQKGKFRA